MTLHSRHETRIKIIKFLRANKNRWFSQDVVATVLGRRYQLISQLDALVATNQGIYRDECIVNDRRKRLFYGYFESKQKASEITPEVEHLKFRSIVGAVASTGIPVEPSLSKNRQSDRLIIECRSRYC